MAKRAKNENYLLKYGARIRGRSGITHKIDLYAEKGDRNKVIVDVSTINSKDSWKDVLKLRAKAFDIGNCTSVLLAIPAVDEEARALAREYGINVLELGRIP